MRRTSAIAAVLLVLSAVPVAAQAPDVSGYCTGDGGAAGAATEAEHSRLAPEPPLPAGLRASNVEINGVMTRVVEGGPPDVDQAVIFVHGHPGSLRDYDELMAAGSRFGRMVAFDVSGYGASDKQATQVQSTAGVSAHIQGVLDTLGVRRAVLLVHDFGGLWALDWAKSHPDLLTAAVLIDTGVLIDYVPHGLAVVWATPGAGEAQMASTTRENFHAFLQATTPRPLPEAFIDRMYDDYDRATRCAALRYYRSAGENLNAGREQAAVLRKRRRPALVIWGEKDPFIPPEQAEKQREAFPDAQIEIFEDSGHWPFVDNAERTQKLVVPFLRPALRAGNVRVGRRFVRVGVAATGVLPAYGVRLRMAGRRSRARTIAPGTSRVLRVRRPRGAGRRVLKLSGRGLATKRFAVRLEP